MTDSTSGYAYVANNPVNLIDPLGLLAQLSGTPMNPAYWGMTADASNWLSGSKLTIQTTIADWGVRNSGYGGEYAAIGVIGVIEVGLPESWSDLLPTKRIGKSAEASKP